MSGPRSAPARHEGVTSTDSESRESHSRRPGGDGGAAAGNLQMLHALGVRAKLKCSAPGDAEEHEADRMADGFIRGERATADCCSSCASDSEKVRRSADEPAGAVQTAMRLPSGGGLPLAHETQRDYERYFSADLSAVRVHTSAPAAHASESIGARAFALGSNIAFAAGE
jgi:hypothetical protein